MRREWVARTTLVLAALVAGFAVVEVLLRAYVRFGGGAGARLAEHDPLYVEVEPYGTVGYRQRAGSSFRYLNGAVAHANRLGYRGPEVSLEKPAAVFRVVLIGGSTTHGWGVDDTATIDAYMRRQLAKRTAPRFEVINAGFDGYDSRQILERVRHDVLRLDPDLLIINAGVNDVRNAHFPNLVEDDPRTMLWGGTLDRLRHEAIHGHSWWTLAKHYSLVLRLPSFVRALRSQQLPERDSTLTGYPEAAQFFERNLRAIAAIADTHDLKLIFATPSSSLRTRYAPSAPPEKSYWLGDAEATAKYRDTLAARMRSVADSLARLGFPIVYLSPELPPQRFLDDAHLTPEGNAAVAELFSDAVLQLFGVRPGSP